MDEDLLESNNKRLERELAEAKMTMRDEFASSAMCAYLFDPSAGWNTEALDNAASAAYRAADAMMKYRSR